MPGKEDSKSWYELSPSDSEDNESIAEVDSSSIINNNPHDILVTDSDTSITTSPTHTSTSTISTASNSNIATSNNSTTSNSESYMNQRFGTMATNLKRAPPMRPLGKDETINSFESWKGNFIYTLNLDSNFAPFLDPNKSWEKKSKNGRPHRGLSCAQEVNFLEMLLGQIANYCPVISRNSIIKNSTSLESVWQQIRSHFGFQTSGSHFLNLCDIRMETGERPEDLFQCLQSFIEDNLLTVGCGISHHGENVTEDEDLSPTLENVIIFLWLQLIHKDLPSLIKVKYGTELRNKSLASIKPEISVALPSLLEELGSSHTPVLRASASGSGFRQNTFNQSSSYNQRSNQPYGTYRQNNSGPNTRSNLSSNRPTSYQSQQRRPMVCSICKNAGRPSNHLLSSCSLLTPDDKKWLSRARLISALDDEMMQLNINEEDLEQQHHEPYQDHNLPHHAQSFFNAQGAPLPSTEYQHTEQTPLPTSRRVITCASPYLNVFHHHTPIKFTLDTGATVNMIHESIAHQLGLTVTPSTQIATQADGKSEIDIVGETRFQVTRDDLILHFEGLVA